MNIRSQKFKELQEFTKLKDLKYFQKDKLDDMLLVKKLMVNVKKIRLHTRSNDIHSFIIKWYFTAVLNVHKQVTENKLDLCEDIIWDNFVKYQRKSHLKHQKHVLVCSFLDFIVILISKKKFVVTWPSVSSWSIGPQMLPGPPAPQHSLELWPQWLSENCLLLVWDFHLLPVCHQRPPSLIHILNLKKTNEISYDAF